MVKGKDVLKKALALLGEDFTAGDPDITDFENSSVFFINMMLAELSDLNTLVNGSKPSPTDVIPQISSLDNEITYCERISLSLMPMGLAFFIAVDEDNGKAALFYNLYKVGIEEMKKTYKTSFLHKIKNVY